jgi:serine/threonine-protein kinase
MQLRPGTRLGVYEILSSLGAGGMGEVYRARDTRLGRDVALKILPSSFADDPEFLMRFQREAEALASLNHPNIAAIYGLEETTSVQALVLELVEGPTLAARIREGPIPIPEVVAIARQITEALGATHERGIVHRDLKPANIKVRPDGTVKVLDFGLAKRVSTQGARTNLHAPSSNVLMGTAAYMSPEQLRGNVVNQSADIWAFGCVLYEMLARQRAFGGHEAFSTLTEVLESEPDWSLLPTETPPAMHRLLRRCLAKSVSERLRDAGDARIELADALAWNASPPGVRRLSPAALAPPAEAQSIAVLPFVNLTADPADEYFCDGMADEIINALSHLPALRVVARTSSFALKGQSLDVGEIAERLKASTILEGSVRKAGKRLRITASLVNATDNCHLWSQSFDRQMKDVFEIQDEIARAVARTSKVALLDPHSLSLVKSGTADLDAYHLCLKGRFFWRQRALMKAIECFEQAVARDPTYARAYCGIADAYSFLGFYGYLSSKETLARAEAAAERAVSVDARLAEAHYSLGLTAFLFRWNFARAEYEFTRALELSPEFAQAHAQLSQLLAVLHRFDEATTAGELAIRCDPLSPLIYSTVGLAYFFQRRYDVAVDCCQRALELDPYSVPAHWVLGLPRVAQEKYADGLAAIRNALSYSQRSPLLLMYLGAALADAGFEEEAKQVLNELEERAGSSYVPAAVLSWIHLHLGNGDAAYAFLEQAFEQRNPQALWPAFWPGEKPRQWRADARVRSLLDRTGLLWFADLWSE